MKPPCFLLIGMALAGFVLACAPCRADRALDYSADQIDLMDDWGFFPPELKSGAQNLFDTNAAIIQANTDAAALRLKLPDYQQKAATAMAKLEELQKELADYTHTDESDFEELKKELTDPKANLEDLIKMTREYVWAYSTSPHQAEALQDLQQLQQKQANQSQAEKDAESAREAARAKFLQRVQARDLSLQEWRDFLYNMSEEDVVRFLGQPDSIQDDYWLYSGDFTRNPQTLNKVGLRLNFIAGRIVTVLGLPHS